jgi:hypothetical protein
VPAALVRLSDCQIVRFPCENNLYGFQGCAAARRGLRADRSGGGRRPGSSGARKRRDDDYQGGRPRFPGPVVARRYAATGTGTARKATVDKGKASSGTSALATPPGKGKD